MNAIVEIDGQLRLAEVPDPAPRPGRLRIAVTAAGVNRADLSQRAGRYAPPPGESAILGLECAGVALEDGGPFRAGDRVCALLAGGGYAEIVSAPIGSVLPIPPGVDDVGAASLVEVLATAWLNLWREGDTRPGHRILVHAGASGVGTAVIQLARALGNPVFAVVGSEAKRAACLALGADAAVNRREEAWEAAARAWAPGGVDRILDPVGATTFAAGLDLLAVEGRWIGIGLMGGREATIDLGRLMTRRLTVRGSVLRARTEEEKAAIVADLAMRVWPMVADGRVRPIVDRTLPLAEAEAAHAVLSADLNIGKVTLVTGRVTDVTSRGSA